MTHPDTTTSFTRAVGEELRRARESVGVSRAALATRLQEEIHYQSLASYERGVRQCTIGRFIDICHAMAIPAAEVLSCALQRAHIDLETTGIQVDLRAIVRDKHTDLRPLRQWATTRLTNEPDSDIVRLTWATTREMATLFDLPHQTFVDYLISFTPEPAPRRR